VFVLSNPFLEVVCLSGCSMACLMCVIGFVWYGMYQDLVLECGRHVPPKVEMELTSQLAVSRQSSRRLVVNLVSVDRRDPG
jgi:hypothetical protein